MCPSIPINFFCVDFWTVIISATFKSILSQSRCSLEPKRFLRVLCPLKSPAGVPEHPPRPFCSIDACYAHFSANYIHSWHKVWYLHVGHPIEENQQCVSIIYKNKPVQRMIEDIPWITKEGKMTKNE